MLSGVGNELAWIWVDVGVENITLESINFGGVCMERFSNAISDACDKSFCSEDEESLLYALSNVSAEETLVSLIVVVELGSGKEKSKSFWKVSAPEYGEEAICPENSLGGISEQERFRSTEVALDAESINGTTFADGKSCVVVDEAAGLLVSYTCYIFKLNLLNVRINFTFNKYNNLNTGTCKGGSWLWKMEGHTNTFYKKY